LLGRRIVQLRESTTMNWDRCVYSCEEAGEDEWEIIDNSFIVFTLQGLRYPSYLFIKTKSTPFLYACDEWP